MREDVYDKMDQMVGLFQRIAFKLDDVGEALDEGRIEAAMYNLGLAHTPWPRTATGRPGTCS